MEIKPGLRRAAIGQIPDDWDMVTLNDLCSSITDGTHFTPKYVKSGVPFYSVENVTADNFVQTKLISEEAHLKLIKRCRPEKGDILLTRIGSLGDTKLLNWNVYASIYVSLALLKFSDKAVSEYVYCYTKSSRFVRDVEKRSLLNASPKKINMKDIGGIPIPVPRSHQERRAIARAFWDIDELLVSMVNLIAKEKDIKLGTMQQLLSGQKRLPGFIMEWERRALSEIASVTKGTQLSSKENNESGPYAHLNGGIGPSGYSEKANMPGGTIAISEGGNSCGYVQFMKEPFWSGGHCYSIAPLDINKNFLYHALKVQQLSIMALRVGSGLPNIQKTTLLAFGLNIPTSVAEQAAIAAVLSDMDDVIAILEARLVKTRALKQGMVQELLSGRIRPL